MNTTQQYESDFEKNLIDRLRTGEINLMTPNPNMDFTQVQRSKLWEYRPDIKTTSQLEQNFKEILERNNQEKLDGPLSPNEFRQVMDTINNLKTPYEAGKFLYGFNGVSQIEVDLDNGKHVYLKVFDQSQVGAGDTVYQVVNQISRPAVIPGNQNRRFDVTLLINGLPIYQIELKSAHADVDEALNQMEQYTNEQQYTGIFSTVQVLMAMTPYNTKYMAATAPGHFNKDFAFTWKDENNRNVGRWDYIADHMLTIPAAHLLATNYMILDGSHNDESIKVMRPYQVMATRTALEQIRSTDFNSFATNKDGYIWHTTGSGKTITSYKTASLAAREPNVDKVVFLVDRKSLTNQTLEVFQGYDPMGTHGLKDNYANIEDTANTRELSRKLKSREGGIIVTSSQKLARLVKQEKFKAPDRNILFIVDEAHRSTGTDTFGTIQKAFPNSAWIGYTGTPNFNAKQIGSRTVDVFGPLLHAYTIRDAIADDNVLGFKVDFNTTVPDDLRLKQLKAYYKELYPSWTDEQIQDKIDHLTGEDMDDAVKGSFYDNNPSHVEAVVKDIVDNWENRSADWQYNALLTTHVAGNKASIPMALMYYREFKRINEIRARHGLRILKVAISVSMDETNSSNMNTVNEGLKEAMADYNALFGTNFGADTFENYQKDLEDRLRKKSDDGQFLDLVIVVDRLLTGFDAPELNTLYVDRILKGAGLIQAYSRTNRIFDNQSKPFGNIVNYRWPEYQEELMNEALSIYSNKNMGALKPENIESGEPGGGVIAPSYTRQIEQTEKIVSRIRTLTDDLKKVPDDPEKQDKLLYALRQYNAQLAKLKQYPVEYNENGERTGGYDYEHPEDLLQDLGISEEENERITTTLSNELRGRIADRDHIPVSMVELRVEHLKDVFIDYDYLSELLQNLMNQVHDDLMDEAASTCNAIFEYSGTFNDPDYASQVKDAATAIFERKYPTADSGLTYPYQISSAKELTDQVIRSAQVALVDSQMEDFRRKWGLLKVADNGTLRLLISRHTFGEDDLDRTLLSGIQKEGSQHYKAEAEDESIRKLSSLKYMLGLKNALKDMADEQAAK